MATDRRAFVGTGPMIHTPAPTRRARPQTRGVGEEEALEPRTRGQHFRGQAAMDAKTVLEHIFDPVMRGREYLQRELGAAGIEESPEEVALTLASLTGVGTAGKAGRARQLEQALPGFRREASTAREAGRLAKEGRTGATVDDVQRMTEMGGQAERMQRRFTQPMQPGEGVLRRAQDARATGGAIRAPMAFETGEEIGAGVLDTLSARERAQRAEIEAQQMRRGESEPDEGPAYPAGPPAEVIPGTDGSHALPEPDEVSFIRRLLSPENLNMMGEFMMLAGAAGQPDINVLMNTMDQVQRQRGLRGDLDRKEEQAAHDDFRAVQRMVEPTARMLGVPSAPLVRARLGSASAEDQALIQEALERYTAQRDPLAMINALGLGGGSGDQNEIDELLMQMGGM